MYKQKNQRFDKRCLLSIITINYNNADGLEKTIKSVISQTFNNYEYIIIDGGSSDKSVSVVERYRNQITYFVSEKDDGIYQAMNKGIKVAKGEYVLMLNSGDFLLSSDVLQRIFQFYPQEDIMYADIWLSDGLAITERRHPDTLTFEFFRHQFISHQSAFIRRELHQKVGLYDEALKVVSDWKFMLLAICKYNASYLRIPLFSSQCDVNGFSNTPEGRKIAFQERNFTYAGDFAAFVPDYEEFDRVRQELNRVNQHMFFRIKRRMKRLLTKRA